MSTFLVIWLYTAGMCLADNIATKQGCTRLHRIVNDVFWPVYVTSAMFVGALRK